MIYGEKTRLRRIEREDIPTFVRWFRDPDVRSFLLVNSPISQAQEEKWLERKLEDDDSELFAIETLDMQEAQERLELFRQMEEGA